MKANEKKGNKYKGVDVGNFAKILANSSSVINIKERDDLIFN